MKTIRKSLVQKTLIDQSGQTIPMAALGMFLLLGMGGLTIDVGRAYSVRTELQNAANAAALAGAPLVYSGGSTIQVPSSQVQTAATAYSASGPSTPPNANYDPSMGTVITTVSTPCITALMSAPATCSNTGNVPNAVRVVESAAVPTYFMSYFGTRTLNVQATATAAPTGVKPTNVAIILDTTPSMNSSDPNCSGQTAEQCALSGIRSFLEMLKPCAAGLDSCDVTTPQAFTRVSLFSFPNVPAYQSGISGSVDNYWTCSKQAVAYPYTLPTVGVVGYTPAKYSGANATNGNPNAGKYAATFTATYQATPANVGGADANGFLSDFYSAKGANSLNSTSILVEEVGNGVATPCLKPPTNLTDAAGYSGGGETYLAAAIYAAQSALQAEKVRADAILAPLNLVSQNAIIVVSDGQMNTNEGEFPKGDGYTSVTNGILNMNSTGAYPSYYDACQQAMQAGQYAKQAGSQVYGVAYGAESSGCLQTSGVDTAVIADPYGAYNYPLSSRNSILPCVTMENLSDSAAHFFAEVSSLDCTITIPANQRMQYLTTIFNGIAGDLGVSSRLIPNSLS